MQGLYAIVDIDTLTQHGLDALQSAAAILRARPAALQLRDKRCDARSTLALLRELRPLARQAEVPLLANDRADLAALAECDGVHVGQQDLPVAAARRVLAVASPGPPIVGLSAHNAAELEDGLREQPDYLALGPVFATVSKVNPDPVLGLEGLAQLGDLARARAPGLPIVAIGGITLERAALVARHCACGAIIGDLLRPSDRRGDPYDALTAQAQALHRALGAA